MLDRLKNVKEFEGNKQYVSELLSILMQSSVANQSKLAATNGIDALLSCVFPYKGRNARSDGEEEYVANLFGCLCSCLMPAENKLKFMQVTCLTLPLHHMLHYTLCTVVKHHIHECHWHWYRHVNCSSCWQRVFTHQGVT